MVAGGQQPRGSRSCRQAGLLFERAAEDGPTHQPVEQLLGLRSIPNMLVIRPADANETATAWQIAIEHTGGPVALALTRQKIPVLDL